MIITDDCPNFKCVDVYSYKVVFPQQFRHDSSESNNERNIIIRYKATKILRNNGHILPKPPKGLITEIINKKLLKQM